MCVFLKLYKTPLTSVNSLHAHTYLRMQEDMDDPIEESTTPPPVEDERLTQQQQKPKFDPNTLVVCVVTASTRFNMVSPSGHDKPVQVQLGYYGLSFANENKFAPSGRTISIVQEEEYGGNLTCSPIATGLLALISVLQKTSTVKNVTIYTDSTVSTNTLEKMLKTPSKTDVYWTNIYANEYIDLLAKINFLLRLRRLDFHYEGGGECNSINDMSTAFGVKLITAPTAGVGKTRQKQPTTELSPFILAEMVGMHRTLQSCVSDTKSVITSHMSEHLSSV